MKDKNLTDDKLAEIDRKAYRARFLFVATAVPILAYVILDWFRERGETE